jgi:uncharacterized DUF497 family protein
MDAKLSWDETKRQINLRKQSLPVPAEKKERLTLFWIENECDEP